MASGVMRSPWNNWPVHPLCNSGHHEMCKRYEDWNWRAMHICGCEECDHPKPTREEFEEAERRIYGHVRFQEESASELDSGTSTDVASWFVEEDETEDVNGHDEAQEPETPMSTTEVPADEQVTQHDEGEVTSEELDGSFVPEEDSTEATSDVDADDSEATADDGDESEDEPKKRKRGELEQEVKGITDKFLSGKIKLPEDKQLTPHYIAIAIEKAYGYNEPPSTGAVAAVLKRWDQYGYAEFGEDPFHFLGLTEEGEARGLAELRTEFKEAKKEERRKAREAKRAAAEAEAAENDDDNDDEGSDEE